MALVPSPTQKRYFVTNKLVNEFPVEFINSRNKRHVIVLTCTLQLDEPDIQDEIEEFTILKFITMHSDFIHDCRYMDSFITYCNRDPIYPKKFEQLTMQRTFTLWFKSIDQEPINMIWKNEHYETADGK